MITWIERFLLTALAAILVGSTVVANPFDLGAPQRIALALALVAASVLAARVLERLRARTASLDSNSASESLAVSGGRGGSGNAIGKGSLAIGGRGGRGGPHAVGRGGDGGGGDAIGDGSMVIGGDGGDAGRVDGRGGDGGASPLKKLSPETLKAFGLTGNEGYGQGGRGGSSPDYERALRVLLSLIAEFSSQNPTARLTPMPGVLMPPVDWVNRCLASKGESFRVLLIDNDTDFLFQQPPHDTTSQHSSAARVKAVSHSTRSVHDIHPDAYRCSRCGNVAVVGSQCQACGYMVDDD